MAKPDCAQKAPYMVELEPGEYWWCACGRSKNQPFCDGSHQGTEFSPTQLTVAEKKTLWLCGCKQSARAPHCDGTHKNVEC